MEKKGEEGEYIDDEEYARQLQAEFDLEKKIGMSNKKDNNTSNDEEIARKQQEEMDLQMALTLNEEEEEKNKKIELEFESNYNKHGPGSDYIRKALVCQKGNNVTPEAIKRITLDMKECIQSESKLIHVCPSTEDIRRASCLIIGPDDTPYMNGFFHFEICFPFDYPWNPPSVMLMTTDYGQCRFNPNLYADGKVCLSILGTWTGPSWSQVQTLMSVLLSIQSLMNSTPYHNEPGYEEKERRKGDSDSYNSIILHETMRVAVVGMLERPTFNQDYFKDERLFLSGMKGGKQSDSGGNDDLEDDDSEGSASSLFSKVCQDWFLEHFDEYAKVCEDMIAAGLENKAMADPFGERRGKFQWEKIQNRLIEVKEKILLSTESEAGSPERIEEGAHDSMEISTPPPQDSHFSQPEENLPEKETCTITTPENPQLQPLESVTKPQSPLTEPIESKQLLELELQKALNVLHVKSTPLSPQPSPTPQQVQMDLELAMKLQHDIYMQDSGMGGMGGMGMGVRTDEYPPYGNSGDFTPIKPPSMEELKQREEQCSSSFEGDGKEGTIVCLVCKASPREYVIPPSCDQPHVYCMSCAEKMVASFKEPKGIRSYSSSLQWNPHSHKRSNRRNRENTTHIKCLLCNKVSRLDEFGGLPGLKRKKKKRRIDPSAVDEGQRCPEHPSEDIQFFCMDCQELLCFSCVSSDEKHSKGKHSVEPLDVALRECGKRMKDISTEISTKRRDALQIAENCRMRASKELPQAADKAKQSAVEGFNVIRKLLDSKEKEVLESIDHVLAEKTQAAEKWANVRTEWASEGGPAQIAQCHAEKITQMAFQQSDGCESMDGFALLKEVEENEEVVRFALMSHLDKLSDSPDKRKIEGEPATLDVNERRFKLPRVSLSAARGVVGGCIRYGEGSSLANQSVVNAAASAVHRFPGGLEMSKSIRHWAKETHKTEAKQDKAGKKKEKKAKTKKTKGMGEEKEGPKHKASKSAVMSGKPIFLGFVPPHLAPPFLPTFGSDGAGPFTDPSYYDYLDEEVPEDFAEFEEDFEDFDDGTFDLMEEDEM